MNKLTLIAIVLMLTSAQAFDLNYRFGVDSNTERKIISVDAAKDLKPWFSLGAEAGLLTQSAIFSSPTYFGELKANLQIEIPYVYARVSQGIAGITKTDKKYLGSHIQFPSTFSAGLHTDSFALGVFYKHFSSGMSKGNNGQDFKGVEARWSF